MEWQDLLGDRDWLGVAININYTDSPNKFMSR